MNGYRFAELARGEGLQSPDTCSCCGREGLKRTVKLISPSGAVVWYGTGCAAKAMSVGVDVVRAGKRAAEDARDTADRTARDAEHSARDAAWQTFLDRAAGPGDRFDQIQKLGGYTAARNLQDAERKAS